MTHDEEHTVDSAVTAETYSVDTVDTRSVDTVDTHSADTDTHAADTHAADTKVETQSADTGDTHASNTAETQSTDTADTHSADTADTPTTDTAATESTDTTDTPPGLLAGTLLTGTAGLDPMGLYGTDSNSPPTDWGSVASTGSSAPSADDTSGSTYDTVAAPDEATAPEVSTTVDASPPATVETAAPTTYEEATAAVASDVDAPVAPASADPAPTEAAPTAAADVAPPAEVVPPPVAVCITADNCTTVLQAMLTSVANIIIAPLSTVSSWFGAIWYQANPEAAPGTSNRWTAAGAPTGSEVASMLMPPGFSTVLRYPTVHGGTPPLGESVQEQIDTLDQTTQASSSSPMSSQITVTSSATAPRKFTRFVRHTLDTIASSPSLIVLTVAALPGLGGFIIIIGAGMRIGYRQAKFSFAMRSSGLARYIRPGPLGVVRSGGLIAVRPRPRARSQRFLEKAA